MRRALEYLNIFVETASEVKQGKNAIMLLVLLVYFEQCFLLSISSTPP